MKISLVVTTYNWKESITSWGRRAEGTPESISAHSSRNAENMD